LSDRQKDLRALSDAVSELNEAEVKERVREEISRGVPAVEIFEHGLKKGLDVVGQRYATGEYALGELAYAGSLVGRILEELKPYLQDAKMNRKGVIIMGAVRGDIHDIGKNIVKMLMICRGWEVHDLGVDVTSSAFVDKVEELSPDILGVTSLLTTTTDQFGEIIDKLKERGLRDKVKVVIAGNAASEEIQNSIGADGTATSAEDGIRKCEELLKK
jgi:methanogenic corrinoid protein MtbC1